jgi:hypothetical protein
MRREVTRHPVDRRQFIAAAGSVIAVASASQAFAQMGGAFLDHAVPGVGLTVSGPVRDLFQRSGHKLDGACNCGEQAGQRSFRAADCDRQAQTRAAARHL